MLYNMYDHILYIYIILYFTHVSYAHLCAYVSKKHAYIYSYHLNHTRGARTRPSRGPVLCFLPGGGWRVPDEAPRGETAGEGWVNMSFFFSQTQTYPLVI